MADRRQQLTTALLQFYNNPVAQVSLELFLSVGAVIFFAIFAIRPTLLTMSDLIKEIEEKRELNTQLDRKRNALSSAQVEYKALESRLPVLDEAIPSSPNLIYTLKIIEKQASENGVIITSIVTPEVPPEGSDTAEPAPAVDLQRQTLPLTITFVGEYPTIRQTIENLQASRRSFIIDTITFTTDEERGRRKLRAIVTFGLPYFGKDSSKTAGTATPKPAAATNLGL
jgi:uncharacterized protein (UPF0333 family)